MEADSSDKKRFFSLVNRQRKEGRQALSQLYVDDRHLTTEEAIREGWASYFEKLATPADNHTYDDNFKQQVDLDFNLICDICSKLQDGLPEISCETVSGIIKTLKNNKAYDGTGISAEHLKYGGRSVSFFIAEVLNSVFRYGKVPQMFKMGYITPIYKKQGKPLYDPNSYRRITITSLIGKVLEKYLLDTAFAELEALQNPLQKGFTKGTSATVAALLFTEAIAEAKDTNTPLYTACIDATKAFDVVWHKSLLRKLYTSGITGTSWNILQDSYHAMSSVVNWCGRPSKSFVEEQGVRQGGIISPTSYKIHINPLLDLMQNSKIGLSIGNVYCGVPTVADDLLFLSRSIIDLQAMLSTQGYFAGLERYLISDSKTKVFIVNSPVDTVTWNQSQIFSINGNPIEVVNECTHLGIKRDSISRSGHSTTVDDRIASARGCAYSLMGAGLHGENGGNPRVSLSLWSAYVLPRLIYGLDVLKLSKSEIQKLNQFHKKILKQIMHLQERTADSAVYLLSGQLPLVADLHKRVLGTLGSVLRSSSIEREIAERQILIKDHKSKSWFVYVNSILSQYSLPSTLDLLNSELTKASWKQTIDEHINTYWVNKIKLEASDKSSLRFLNTENYEIGEVHCVWKNAGFNPMAIKKAGIKARLMTGTYVLQSVRAKFNQYNVDPTCLLCGENPEDHEHFLLRCRSLAESRDSFIETIKSVLSQYLGDEVQQCICRDSELLVALILDCTAVELNLRETQREDFLSKFESVARGLCYALHCKRTRLLNELK